MTQTWTQSRIEKLLQDGKIRSCAGLGRNPAVKKWVKKKGDKAKAFISWNVAIWAEENDFDLMMEHRFHPVRKWRFDWALIKGKKLLAVEYEGLMSEKSGHTTVGGYTKDVGKYNEAQALGWKVLRFTAVNYKTLITELNKHI